MATATWKSRWVSTPLTSPQPPSPAFRRRSSSRPKLLSMWRSLRPEERERTDDTVRGHVRSELLLRSRRCSGPGRPSGDTKVSGRRVTRKAPWLTWKEGQAAPRHRPQPFSRILTAWKGLSRTFSCTGFSEVPQPTWCPGAHTFPSDRSMVYSLRGTRTSRERARPLPALLLDLGSLPERLPAARQERLAGSSAREGVLGYVHEASRYEQGGHLLSPCAHVVCRGSLVDQVPRAHSGL